ncbi:major facilitator superfamily protein [Sphingobium sp. SYK-6]|uniref:MFS transporter n=1 Tax=Sphingobium sp. (strain NBRC 103272 / SYK-6) TaxID=627192 RepID=UPI0002277351|nr:MFS transporter [Sphingobium sp. SYK-6]BAK67034.1 major facilitator superfamily protein [Sphingobium sp. SYK-6]
MTGAATAAGAEPRYESDFSFRKIKLATIITLANMFATSLLPFGAITLVNVPMTQEFGWSQTEYSWAMTALMWCGAVTLPFYGKFMDKVGVRLPIFFGTIGVGLATIALGFIDGTLWQFYLCFAMLGIFGSTAIGYTKIVSALFTQHRGKAMALLGVESTLAGAGIPPLLNWLITDFGWREMFIICGCIVLLLLPVIYFTVDEPGEIGSDRKLIRPKAEVKEDRSAKLEGLTDKQILRDRVFWLIVIATIIGTAPRTGMMPFLVPMLNEKGFSQGDAVTYMSITTLIAPLGTLVGGWAVDRFNTSRVAIPFKFISFLGLFLFAMVTASFGGWYLLAMAVGLGGFAFGTARPIGTYLHVRFFGLKAFGFYHGFENMFLAFSMGCAPPLVAWLHDSSGSYMSGYVIMLVCLALGTILYWILGPYRYASNIGAVPLPDEAESRKDGAPASAPGLAAPAAG